MLLTFISSFLLCKSSPFNFSIIPWWGGCIVSLSIDGWWRFNRSFCFKRTLKTVIDQKVCLGTLPWPKGRSLTALVTAYTFRPKRHSTLGHAFGNYECALPPGYGHMFTISITISMKLYFRNMAITGLIFRPWVMQCLNDGTPEVRDAAFSALAEIAKVPIFIHHLLVFPPQFIIYLQQYKEFFAICFLLSGGWHEASRKVTGETRWYQKEET